jgi:phage-related minor tail protein
MAGGKIKGISISIDGNTKPLQKALGDVNKRSKELQGELKQIDRLVKFSPKDTTLLAQKQRVLADTVQNTATKLQKLRDAQSQVNEAFRKGEISQSNYEAFQREIIETESKLNHYSSQLSKVESKQREASSSVKKLAKSFKEAGTKAKEFGSEVGRGLGAAGAAGATAVGGLVLGMEETNQQLGMLETQVSQVGLTLDDLGSATDNFASIGQDVNQTTEAMGNLVQAGYQTKESLNGISESISGAIVKYGETFNIEGLAESITTTTQLGEVTGQFMDLLEKENVNVDAFNTKLESMSSAEERANLVSKTLAEQGLTSMFTKYQEMNPEVIKQAEAQRKFQQSLSELSIVLTPLVTEVTKVVTSIANWAAENPKLSSTLATVGGVLATIVGVFAALAPIVSVLINLWPVLAAAFGAITAPVAAVIAGIAALIAIGIALYKNWDEVKAKGIEVWNSLSSFFSNFFTTLKSLFDAALNWIDSKTNGKFKVITNAIRLYMKTTQEVISTIWEFVKGTFSNALSFLKSLVKGDFQGMKDAISNQMQLAKSTISKIWGSIKSFFSSVLSSILSAVTQKFASIVSSVRGKMNDVKSKVQDGINRVKSFLSGINLKQMGKDMIQGLINGIGSMAKNLVKKAKGVVNGAIEGAKNLLGIASPSRVFMEIGEYTGEGMAIGMDKVGSMVRQSSERMANAAIPDVSSFNTPSVSQDGGITNPNYNGSITLQIDLDGDTIGRKTYDTINNLLYRDMLVASRTHGTWKR